MVYFITVKLGLVCDLIASISGKCSNAGRLFVCLFAPSKFLVAIVFIFNYYFLRYLSYIEGCKTFNKLQMKAK